MCRFAWVVAALAVFGPVQSAAAQSTAPAKVVAGEDGFAIESDDGDYRLQIGVLAQADARFDLDDQDHTFIDTFIIRRLRPYLRGRLSRWFEFLVNPDFAGGTLVLQDAYIDTVMSPAFRLRAGKSKTPFGMERLQASSNLLFIERALPTSLVPNRDLGMQVLGELHGGVFSYDAAVTNGVADGASTNTDTNDAKDVSARIVFRPLARHRKESFRSIGVAFSGSTGREEGAGELPTFSTTLLQVRYFSYATDAVADGRRTRYSPQAFGFVGPFGGWVEYVHTDMPVALAGVTEDIWNRAWQVAGSWVLTGEAATDSVQGVRPRAPFDPPAGHWGAFQVAARIHQLEVDPSVVTLGFAAPGSSRKADAWTVGLNWYLTVNVRYTLNFERTVFDDDPDGPRKPENALVFRTQIAF